MFRPSLTRIAHAIKRFGGRWLKYASPRKPTYPSCAFWALLGHTEITLSGAIFVESCLGIRPPQGSLPAQFAIAAFGPIIGTLALLKADRMARVLRLPRIAIVVGGAMIVAALTSFLTLHPIQPLQNPPNWLLPVIHWLRAES